MSDWEVPTVTIDGNYPGTYRMTTDQVDDLTTDFGNSSSSTIYLYAVDSNAYISIDRAGNAYYRPASGYNSYDVVGVTSVDFNARAHYEREKGYLSIICCILAIAVMLRRLVRNV